MDNTAASKPLPHAYTYLGNIASLTGGPTRVFGGKAGSVLGFSGQITQKVGNIDRLHPSPILGTNGHGSWSDDTKLSTVSGNLGPPPQISVMPSGMPMPEIVCCVWGNTKVRCKLGGEEKGTASTKGRSSTPDRRGKMAPFGTNATNPLPANCCCNQT
eukprot:scaffold2476_cov193-Amphora_coffeaeformis.AAC.18